MRRLEHKYQRGTDSREGLRILMALELRTGSNEGIEIGSQKNSATTTNDGRGEGQFRNA